MPSYDDLLINTCSLVNDTLDKWGDVASTVVTAGVKCRIMYTNKIVKDFKGQEVVAHAKIFFKKDQTIAYSTIVRIGTDDRPIVKISKPQDSVEIHHKEVWIT